MFSGAEIAGSRIGEDELVRHFLLHHLHECRAAVVHRHHVVEVDLLKGLDGLGDVGLQREGEVEASNRGGDRLSLNQDTTNNP